MGAVLPWYLAEQQEFLPVVVRQGVFDGVYSTRYDNLDRGY